VSDIHTPATPSDTLTHTHTHTNPQTHTPTHLHPHILSIHIHTRTRSRAYTAYMYYVVRVKIIFWLRKVKRTCVVVVVLLTILSLCISAKFRLSYSHGKNILNPHVPTRVCRHYIILWTSPSRLFSVVLLIKARRE